MANKWAEIESSAQFKQLDPAKQSAVKQRFFESRIAPQTPPEHLEVVRSRFLGVAPQPAAQPESQAPARALEQESRPAGPASGIDQYLPSNTGWGSGARGVLGQMREAVVNPRPAPLPGVNSADIERNTGEAIVDTATGIGQAGLGMGAGIVRSANQRSPGVSDAVADASERLRQEPAAFRRDMRGSVLGAELGAEIGFRGREALGAVGKALGGLADTVRGVFPSAGFELDRIGARGEQRLADSMEARAAQPESDRLRSSTAEAAADWMDERAKRASDVQSPLARAIAAETAALGEIEGLGDQLTATLDYFASPFLRGDFATGAARAGKMTESLIPSLALGGAAARGAGAVGFGNAGQTAAQLGSMAVAEGGGAGEGARAQILGTPLEELQGSPEFETALRLAGGDPIRARLILSDQAASIASTLGMAASAATMGLGEVAGLNVTEKALREGVASLGTGRGIAGAALGVAGASGREFAGEFAQGAGNQLSENLGLFAAGEEDAIGRGVVSSGIMEGVASIGPAAAGQTAGEVARRIRPLEDGEDLLGGSNVNTGAPGAAEPGGLNIPDDPAAPAFTTDQVMQARDAQLATLRAKRDGRPDQTVTDPVTGKPVTIPGAPAEFLSDAERYMLDWLEANGEDASKLARAMGGRLADPAEAAPEAPPAPNIPPAAPNIEQPAPNIGAAQAAPGVDADILLGPDPVEEQESAAPQGVPMMVTQGMKAQLRERGYTDADIRRMTPQQAWGAINATPVDADGLLLDEAEAELRALDEIETTPGVVGAALRGQETPPVAGPVATDPTNEATRNEDLQQGPRQEFQEDGQPAAPEVARQELRPQGQQEEVAAPAASAPQGVVAGALAATPEPAPQQSPEKEKRDDLTLQNRDRGRAASVLQMQQIANNPDPKRLSFSRDPASGAPMAFVAGDAQAIPESDMGKEDTVTMSSGRTVPVRYAVVEADQVLASNRADGTTVPEYEAAPQPGQIRALNNGRTAGVQAAFERGKASGYIEGIAADSAIHGVSPEAIRSKRRPLLVRIYPESFNTGDMGAESNVSQALGLSPTEQAQSDARALPDMSDLAVAEDGDLLTASNRGFVTGWMRNLGANQAASLVDADGRPNKAAVDRLRAAIFMAAYGDESLTSAIAEEANPDLKNLLAALTIAAPEFAKIDRDGPLGDVAAKVAAGVNLIRDARARGVRVGAVTDMFAERDMVAERFAIDMDRRIRAPRKLGELLREIAKFVANEQMADSSLDMFGRPQASYDAVLAYVDRYLEAQDAQQTPRPIAGGLFTAGGKPRQQPAAAPPAASQDDAGAGGSPVQPARAEGERAPEGSGRAGRVEPEAAPDAIGNGQAQNAEEAVAREMLRLADEIERLGTDGGRRRLDDKWAEGAIKRTIVGDNFIRGALYGAKGPLASAKISLSKAKTLADVRRIAERLAEKSRESANEIAQEAAPSQGEKVEAASDPAPVDAAAELAAISLDDLSALIDDVAAEVGAAETQKPLKQRKPRAPKARGSAPKKPRTAKSPAEQSRTEGRKLEDLAKSLGINTTGAGMEALKGLSELFGGPGRLNSGLSFDEQTYAKAKPHFQKALAHTVAAGKDLRDLVRELVITFGQGIKPYLIRFAQEARDVPSTPGDVERGGEAGEASASDMAEADGAPDGQDADGAGSAGGRMGADLPGADGTRGPAGGAASDGASSDQRVPAQQPDGRESAAGDAGAADGRGSGVDGGSGVQADRDGAQGATEAAAGARGDRDKLSEQRAAESIPVTLGDLDNIRATLPYLLEGQQEDVAKAEARFAKPDGYGMLFTNGTGTGKTFTGLGVVKRFQRQGKTNILIVAPSDKIMADWISSGVPLGLDITALEDTADAGRGIVVTTYANLGQNDALAKREWDLIVADEAHYLMRSADGKRTAALDTLRAITLHPDGHMQRADMLHRDLVDRGYQLSEAAALARKSDDQREWARAEGLQQQANAVFAELKARRDEMKDEVLSRQGAARPRDVFLSATPFAYEKTVDWAQGYLFQYPDSSGRGYNSPDSFGAFMMQNFGYRMRYGKLTAPEAGVDSGLMQRMFNTRLKREGVLSGRRLDVAADYSRNFVLVESAIGRRIDQALEWLRENDSTREIADKVRESFDYLARRYTLEALKARESVDLIREHLALGRKVVVFHDYKKGGARNPFDFNPDDFGLTEGQTIEEFREEFGDLIEAMSGLVSPIDLLQREFPDLLLFNGDVSPKNRRANVETFNDDANGPRVILVQTDAGKEGISLHDTTGAHQRALINLGMPTKPTDLIQQEGRIYRTGQVSNAIFSYLNTGTSWERATFAQTIAGRASAAENLGMGEEARALKDSLVQAFEDSAMLRPGYEGEGTGGKESDAAAARMLTEHDRAVALYYANQKKTQRTKSAEGTDYFATPEPVGLAMVRMADIRPGESALEPSAGHGAIARWFGETVKKTAVEPSPELASRLALSFDGRIVDGRFESLDLVNKFDAIVMNPPFGTAGRTAVDHVAKAAKHLREGGRLVALIPTGPAADKKFDAWLYEQDDKGRSVHADLHLVATVELPAVTFEHAGTSVRTRIVVIDKMTGDVNMQTQGRDLSSAETIKELFERVERLEIRPRAKVAGEAASFDAAPATQTERKKQAEWKDEARESAKEAGVAPTGEPIVIHITQKGKELVGVVRTGITKAQAQAIDAYTFAKNGGWFIRVEHLKPAGNFSRPRSAARGEAVVDQTETPEFKAWFGDWQALRAQQRMDAMDPIKISIPPQWRGFSTSELRRRVAEVLDSLVREGATIEHPEVGPVRIERAGQRKTISEGRDPAKLLIAADLRGVLPSAVLAGRAPVDGRQNVRAFVKLLAPVDVGGTRLAAVFTLQERTDGTAYYNSVALEDQKQEAPTKAGAPTPGPVRGSTAEAEGGPLLTEVAGFSRRPLIRVNPNTVSKVVDANGEPLVVYHGTADNFAAFDPAKRGSVTDTSDSREGFFFTSSTRRANAAASDASYPGGDNVMPVYLRMVNPRVVRGAQGLPAQTARTIRQARKAGHDGVVFERGERGGSDYVVFYPEQIKSAIGNRGTFDPADPRITYSQPMPGDRIPMGALRSETAMRLAVAAALDSWNGSKPIVRVVRTAAELPADAKMGEGWQDAEGYFDGADGVWLVTDNLSDPQRALEVLRHEAVGHFGVERIAGAAWPSILAGVEALRGQKRNSMSRPMAAALAEVEARYPDAAASDPVLFAKELIAVMSETGTRASFMDRLVTATRQFLRKLGLIGEAFSEAEIRNVLSQAFRLVERGDITAGAPVAAAGMQSIRPDDVAAYILRTMATSDTDLFKYPKSDSKSFATVVKDVSKNAITAVKLGEVEANFTENTEDLLPAMKWGLRLPDGAQAFVYIEQPSPYTPESGPRLYIDASQGNAGASLGSAAYAALFQWALNTGHTFIGDPAGLSSEALLRRTEHMLSAALKHGTTRMMAPHDRQIDPMNQRHGPPQRWAAPLEWTDGDDVGNITALIRASVENMRGLMEGTDGEAAVYRLSDGQFVGAGGQALDEAGLRRIAAEAGERFRTSGRFPGRQSRAAAIGGATVARALVLKSVLDGSRGAAGQRRELLAQLAERLSAQRLTFDQARRVFYSRPRQGQPEPARSDVVSAQSKMLEGIADGQPLDKMFRLPFRIAGAIDSQGRLQKGVQLSNAIRDVLTNWSPHPGGSFGWMAPMIERARAGLIDRYKLTDEYQMRDRERIAQERAISKRGGDIVRALSEAGVGLEESKVLQAVLTGEQISEGDYAKLAAPIREAITELGREAVELGLISAEAFERNKLTYLHRSYAKHEAEVDESAIKRWVDNSLTSRRRKIAGNSFKGRGMDKRATMADIVRAAPSDWWGRRIEKGQADKQLKGREFIIFDRVAPRGQGTETAPGIEPGGRPDRTLERHYWPSDLPVPAKYEAWENRGKWEVRDVSGDKVTLWRDFTKAERERMGEIVDARYNIAKTFHLLAHDLATARFFDDIARNPEWAAKTMPTSGVIVDASEASRLRTWAGVDWVKVPDVTIPRSQAKKYGALSGRWVRAEIWRDIQELDRMHNPSSWAWVLTQWKLNKTARSPVVHMNNVMSNLLLMDMADVRLQDLVRGFESYVKQDANYQDALNYGAFGGSMVAAEFRRDVLQPLLTEILADSRNAGGGLDGKLKILTKIIDGLHAGWKKYDNAVTWAYQAEDEIFRMATFMRRRALGDSPQIAAATALEQFLNYDIRAPWVNALRRTVMPFISYTYRAVPVVAQSIAHRPWKLAKYATVAWLVNAMGYMLAPGDEDEERRSMRSQDQGYTWVGVPRMIRMPYRDRNDNPVFLDVRRWIPAGDIFDTNQGQTALPIPAPLQFGGPLMLGAEFMLNKQAFTGRDIVNPLTDTLSDRLEKVGGWAYKSWMPSAAYIPGSWYWDAVGTALGGGRDQLGRPYSVPNALLSSVGIKARPHDVEFGFEMHELNYQRTLRALQFEARMLESDLDRGLISEDAYNRSMRRVEQKMDRLDQKIGEVFGDGGD